jgi:hypothetical protein
MPFGDCRELKQLSSGGEYYSMKDYFVGKNTDVLPSAMN